MKINFQDWEYLTKTFGFTCTLKEFENHVEKLLIAENEKSEEEKEEGRLIRNRSDFTEQHRQEILEQDNWSSEEREKIKNMSRDEFHDWYWELVSMCE